MGDGSIAPFRVRGLEEPACLLYADDTQLFAAATTNNGKRVGGFWIHMAAVRVKSLAQSNPNCSWGRGCLRVLRVALDGLRASRLDLGLLPILEFLFERRASQVILSRLIA